MISDFKNNSFELKRNIKFQTIVTPLTKCGAFRLLV